MPKSKVHQRRRLKKQQDQEKLVKWAQRKSAELAALSPEEQMGRWSFAPWRRKPEVVDVTVSEDEN